MDFEIISPTRLNTKADPPGWYRHQMLQNG